MREGEHKRWRCRGGGQPQNHPGGAGPAAHTRNCAERQPGSLAPAATPLWWVGLSRGSKPPHPQAPLAAIAKASQSGLVLPPGASDLFFGCMFFVFAANVLPQLRSSVIFPNSIRRILSFFEKTY